MGRVFFVGGKVGIIKPGARLPTGYTELQYIQSSGTQYLNTGFKPNQNTRVVMDAQYAKTSTGTEFYFGVRDNNNVSEFNMRIRDNSAAFFSEYGNDTTGVALTEDFTKRLTIDFNKTSVKVGSASGTHPARTFQCNYELCLFALNSGGSMTAYSTALQVFSCQIYDNDILVRDFIPCRSDTGVVGMYDSVNKVFYADASGNGFISGPMTTVPTGYTKLEYIQSSGTQYFDTGYKPNQSTRVVIDIDITPTSTTGIFGCRNGAYSNMFYMLSRSSTQYGDAYGTADGSPNGTVPGRKTIDKNQGITYVNGAQLISWGAQTFSCAYNLLLLNVMNGGGLWSGASTTAKLYSCQIYDNGTMVRDYVPCVTDAGKIGLFDLVNNKFYDNSGSGEFVGSEVA